MITHDVGNTNWFWGIDKAYSVPILFRTIVSEAEYPYRTSMATGLHYYRGKAILVGRWGKASTNPTSHLLNALRGRYFDPQDSTQLA